MKQKKEKGVTLISIVITIIILLILAGVSIIYLQGDNSIVETATDAQIETELSELQGKLNKYKVDEEADRISNGDYSGELTNTDLAKEGIIKEIYVKDTGKTIGIIDIEKLGESSELGNNSKNINKSEIESIEELEDVFIIEYGTNDIYYIKGKENWIREGEAGQSKEKEEAIEKGPIISVTPSTYKGEEGTVEVEIQIEERENELSSANKYEYYLSTKEDDLEKGEWKEYKEGEKETIGEDLTGEYYLYVKEIEDIKGIKSTGGKEVIIDGKRYHRYGPYIFNNGKIIRYTIEYELGGGEVEGNPTSYTNKTGTFILKEPKRKGHTFIGWTGSNGETPQKEVRVEKGSTGNRKYIANWEINSYTVTYDYETNGGTSSTKTTDNVKYGGEVDLSPTATKEGYTFIGWNTDKDATIGLTSLTMELSNITLYAIYIDINLPIMGILTKQPDEWTNGNVVITGKAKDIGSGISYYQFSTNVNLEKDSNGWIEIKNTKEEIIRTYTAQNNGIYYFYVKDKVGNINKKAIIINNIDKELPVVTLGTNGGSYIKPSNGKTIISTTITAQDTGKSGIDILEYAWSTSNIEKPNSWNSFTNGQAVTKEDCEANNYYLWIRVLDKAGNEAKEINISNAFKVYSINLQSGPDKMEYEAYEEVDYTGITLLKYNPAEENEIIDGKIYVSDCEKNDDATNSIRYKITVKYDEQNIWIIDTYKSGWYYNKNNTTGLDDWYYYENNGQKVVGERKLKSTTKPDMDVWYLFDNNGLMQREWKYTNGKYKYYMGINVNNAKDLYAKGFNDGAMLTSNWAQIYDGTSKYYWYYFDADGYMKTGWLYLNGYYYYLKPLGFSAWPGPEGSLLTNTTVTIDGKSYTFDAGGVCLNP